MCTCTIADVDQKSATLGSISCEIAFRGAMKASSRILLAFKFEFMSCLARILECDLVSKLNEWQHEHQHQMSWVRSLPVRVWPDCGCPRRVLWLTHRWSSGRIVPCHVSRSVQTRVRFPAGAYFVFWNLKISCVDILKLVWYEQGSGEFWAPPAKIRPFTTSTSFIRISLVANLLPLIWTGRYCIPFFKCRLISSSL
jgi:hypothetical protein